jgi:hypothetical protein
MIAGICAILKERSKELVDWVKVHGFIAISIKRTNADERWAIGGLENLSGFGMEEYFKAESISSDFPELRVKSRLSTRKLNRLSRLQNSPYWLISVRARLQSCRKWPIPNPALAAAELQDAENK